MRCPTEDPSATAGQAGGCCPPPWLAVPPRPLTPVARGPGHTQDLPCPDHVRLNPQIAASSNMLVRCTSTLGGKKVSSLKDDDGKADH